MEIVKAVPYCWRDFFNQIRSDPCWLTLKAFLDRERAHASVYPPPDQVWRAIELTPAEQVKVVILGQDPYHAPGQAMGLAFSVPKGMALPPSLVNIFKELSRDLQIPLSGEGDLTPWASQGVLLLNTVLTVRRGEPLSHQGRGWEEITQALLLFLIKHQPYLAILAWGKHAQERAEALLGQAPSPNKILLLKAPHPSPLSAHRGFLGCHHFSTVNQWLESHSLASIDWAL